MAKVIAGFFKYELDIKKVDFFFPLVRSFCMFHFSVALRSVRAFLIGRLFFYAYSEERSAKFWFPILDTMASTMSSSPAM